MHSGTVNRDEKSDWSDWWFDKAINNNGEVISTRYISNIITKMEFDTGNTCFSGHTIIICHTKYGSVHRMNNGTGENTLDKVADTSRCISGALTKKLGTIISYSSATNVENIRHINDGKCPAIAYILDTILDFGRSDGFVRNEGFGESLQSGFDFSKPLSAEDVYTLLSGYRPIKYKYIDKHNSELPEITDDDIPEIIPTKELVKVKSFRKVKKTAERLDTLRKIKENKEVKQFAKVENFQ